MSKILVVEDNEMNRDMLSRRLMKRGYAVTMAADAQQAVAAIAAERPDLVLMDVGLPGKDGHQLTRELKSDPATAPIPVIALTSHAMSTDRAKALAAGCDEYDTKPVEFDRLVGKIEALLK